MENYSLRYIPTAKVIVNVSYSQSVIDIRTEYSATALKESHFLETDFDVLQGIDAYVLATIATVKGVKLGPATFFKEC